ncbi:MAG TPA: alpha/beta hydrolase [Gammaproteobacteria bacterium]|nr:alpha/beta hydrolase [Gammaproteobacteria bacterium]
MFGSHKPGPEREDKANAQPLYAGTHKTATPAGLTKALTVIGLAALLFGARAFGAETSILDAYPGRLVSIGTHSIHLDCRGNGQPTIVLESGIGGFSLEWHAVQSALAAHTRVCAYDRAGYGWSESGPMPRTATRSAGELHTLLAAAGEAPPYLLAAHSYGGFIVRLFAERHPDEVRGLVLVDASAPEQFERLPAGALPLALVAALRDGARVRSLPKPGKIFPVGLRTQGLHLMLLPKARRAYISEMRHFEAGARRLLQQQNAALDMPVIVISHARTIFPADAGGRQSERMWRTMQRRMALLSKQSDHWIAAGAGHQVHADRPDLVALALRQAQQQQSPSGSTDRDSMVRLVVSVR